MKPFQNIIVLKVLLFLFYYIVLFFTSCYLWFILDFSIFDGFLSEFDVFSLLILYHCSPPVRSCKL